MSSNKNTFQPDFNVSNASDFKSALNTLNENIHSITKQISYLDTYNIVDAITNKDTFEAQVANLAPNSSLVINTNPFYVNKELYNQGDLVLKLIDERVIHIKAQNGGIYYPSQIIKDNDNYILTYEYSPTQPLVSYDKADIKNQEKIDEPAKSITFTNLQIPEQEFNYIYGYWKKFEGSTFDFLKNTWINKEEQSKTEIKPMIKFYLSDGETIFDEIVIDYTLTSISTEDGEKWQIIIDNDISNLWVKVK